MEWKIKDSCVEKSVNQFLNTGAPVPENSTLIGRYHAPGSVKGWLIVETDDLNTIYQHTSEWAELLHFKTTPVVTDQNAAKVCSDVWTKSNQSSD